MSRIYTYAVASACPRLYFSYLHFLSACICEGILLQHFYSIVALTNIHVKAFLEELLFASEAEPLLTAVIYVAQVSVSL